MTCRGGQLLPASAVITYVIRSARVLCAALALPLLGAFAAPAGAAAPRAQLRGFVCQRALEPASRAIAVTSVMRPVRHTQAMAVRFELLTRVKGASGFTTVTGSDLGRWVSPADRTLGRRPGDVWKLIKPVVDLPAPAAYRLRVSFRWTGAHRRVLAQSVMSTGNCLQPELRPDLVIRRIDAPRPNRRGTFDFYSVTVGNAGATAAGQFTVQLAAPGSAPVLAQVAGLAAHTTTVVTLRGPLCAPANPPTVTVDPQNNVEDFDRANNVAMASCTSASRPFPAS